MVAIVTLLSQWLLSSYMSIRALDVNFSFTLNYNSIRFNLFSKILKENVQKKGETAPDCISHFCLQTDPSQPQPGTSSNSGRCHLTSFTTSWSQQDETGPESCLCPTAKPAFSVGIFFNIKFYCCGQALFVNCRFQGCLPPIPNS